MQNKKFLAAAILAVSAAGAFAQTPPAPAQQAPHVALAAQAGQDPNTVTRDEYLKRAGARFDKLDVNKDGKLSADERKAEPQGRAGAPVTREQFLQRAGLRFDLLDVNKDGKLTADERHARPHGPGPAHPVGAASQPGQGAPAAAPAPKH